VTLPKQKDVEIPLLYVISEFGGEAKPRDIYPRITAFFPQITQADLRETVSGNTNKWTNRIQFARQDLVSKKELERYPRGVWKITQKGRNRLKKEGYKGTSTVVSKPPEISSRHSDLKQKMVEVGKKLGYYTRTEEGSIYRHDVLWKLGQYKQDPNVVIEICAGGSLPKDFDALNWATENVGAKGILVTVEDADYRKAVQRFENQDKIVVVKAETVDRFLDLLDENIEFLRIVFK